MDSISHTSMGVGIVAFATINPEVAEVVSTGGPQFWILMIAVFLASFCPDFDVFMRWIGQDRFLTIHRAKSHSIFIVLLMAIGLTAAFTNALPGIPTMTLFIIMYIAAMIHILTDVFNNYGTQFMWPFNKKWYALSITNTADAGVLIINFAGIALWATSSLIPSINIAPWIIYIPVLLAWILYFGVKAAKKIDIKKRLKEKYKDEELLLVGVLARTTASKWKYIIETPKEFKMGFVTNKKIYEKDIKVKTQRLPEKYWDVIRADGTYKRFRDFSPVFYYAARKLENGHHRIKFTDLRYMDESGHYSFNLVYDFTNETKFVKHVGWVFNQAKLERKIQHIKKKAGH